MQKLIGSVLNITYWDFHKMESFCVHYPIPRGDIINAVLKGVDHFHKQYPNSKFCELNISAHYLKVLNDEKQEPPDFSYFSEWR